MSDLENKKHKDANAIDPIDAEVQDLVEQELKAQGNEQVVEANLPSDESIKEEFQRLLENELPHDIRAKLDELWNERQDLEVTKSVIWELIQKEELEAGEGIKELLIILNQKLSSLWIEIQDMVRAKTRFGVPDEKPE